MGLFSMTQTAAFAGRLLDQKIATEPMIQMTAFKPSFPLERKSTSLPKCPPEEEGIPSSLITSFLHALASDRSLNMHNILIVRNGKILSETSFGGQRPDVWKYTFSACKSVISLAIGMLIDDGLIDLEDRVIEFFPKETGAIAKLKLKDLTVEDLLTMRSSVSFAELDSAVESDWIRGYFSSPLKGEVGKTFKYNSLNTYILTAILVRKTGMSLSAFLDERLFSPLGIARSDWYWETCPLGIEKGGWGLFIYPEDFAKIAQLVVQKGLWEGKQLISEEYLDAATSTKVSVLHESKLFDYGYQIWTGKQTDSFLFNGMLGQNVLCFKKSGLIIVATAGNGELFHQSSFFKYANQFFDREFTAPTTMLPKEYAALREYELSLSSYYSPKPRHSLLRRLLQWFGLIKTDKPGYQFDQLVGKQYLYFSGYEKAVGLLPLILQGVENHYTKGFYGISFEREEEIDVLVYEEKDVVYRLPIGYEVPKLIELEFGKNRFLVAVKGVFKQDEEDRQVFILRIDFIEFPSSRILKLIFLDDDTILIQHEELPGKQFAVTLVKDYLTEMTEKPIISSVLDRLGGDYMEFKAERIFAPSVTVKLIREQETSQKTND